MFCLFLNISSHVVNALRCQVMFDHLSLFLASTASHGRHRESQASHAPWDELHYTGTLFFFFSLQVGINDGWIVTQPSKSVVKPKGYFSSVVLRQVLQSYSKKIKPLNWNHLKACKAIIKRWITSSAPPLFTIDYFLSLFSGDRGLNNFLLLKLIKIIKNPSKLPH